MYSDEDNYWFEDLMRKQEQKLTEELERTLYEIGKEFGIAKMNEIFKIVEDRLVKEMEEYYEADTKRAS